MKKPAPYVEYEPSNDALDVVVIDAVSAVS